MLHRLMIDLVHFTHPQHVCPFRLEQATDVAAEGRRGIARAGDEKRGEQLQMCAERLWEALQGRNQRGGGIFTT